jgi:Ca2+-dependent lipid-binding protein
MDPYAVIKSNG